jgi:hypothetical protein
MTETPSPGVRPTWLTIGIVVAIGATLFLAGVTTINSMQNSWDWLKGIAVSAGGALVLLIGIILLVVRSVRIGMRR